MPNVIIKSYSGSKCLRTAELPFENGVDEFDGCKLKIEACAEEKDGCSNYRLAVTSLAETAEESKSVLKQDYFAELKKYNIPAKSKIIIEKGEANEQKSN